MRPWLAIILLAGAPAISPALTPEEQDAMKEIGAVLAWRLGPEAIRDRCAALNPAGADAHRKAVAEWLEKNSKLLYAVDERVAEVLPLIRRTVRGADAVAEARAAVRSMVVEPLFAKRGAEESKEICAREADSASPRLAKSGLRPVQQALAALYDVKIVLEGRRGD